MCVASSIRNFIEWSWRQASLITAVLQRSEGAPPYIQAQLNTADMIYRVQLQNSWHYDNTSQWPPGVAWRGGKHWRVRTVHTTQQRDYLNCATVVPPVENSVTLQLTVKFKWGTLPYLYLTLKTWNHIIYVNRLPFSNIAADIKMYFVNPCIL